MGRRLGGSGTPQGDDGMPVSPALSRACALCGQALPSGEQPVVITVTLAQHPAADTAAFALCPGCAGSVDDLSVTDLAMVLRITLRDWSCYDARGALFRPS